jgi:hypothetical protein
MIQATESQEQKALFEWACLMTAKYKELELLFHIPNGGRRDAITGARLKAEGVKPGVPDLMLPVARNTYNGLFIEMKSASGWLNDNQARWIELLQNQNYCVVVCYGFNEARNILLNYLMGSYGGLA